ncbi:UDP-N-acetylmuramoyl-L-alanyl-D-glutamate--2,6-diaminopimelate ligase [Actibacterium sp. 188UL27-1]|uniref:UDP-N-acetylmuramoyl-L-alanyl-D-glutamate--2, 6-diaminopimelate ligase n=1 Tax=Actibacterium sp. 188UL27-1 TaxID=2786961 RepID=UPI001959F9DC|nr:UDP-N-acetylmuramoyl-L-alanyl-D-glutamate--2,6-diaminopimelate ligase [Actibacterium sp. 188UL27-1]MBM7068454.1 UDP-N-acetylmuramoyl-L-alanyl-D-glutamate--2,6-diaminopimelate ligase [Actibacterium sp. 188UL27-1]
MGLGKAKALAQLGLTAQGGQEARIKGLALDSRGVKDSFLFAALPGTRVHGGEFIEYALRMGASAILTDSQGARIAAEHLNASHAALVIVEDPRQALAYAAALWSGAQPDVMVAVTGTNGKTSVASFARQIWSALGFSAVNLGTTGVEGAWEAPLAHTTPDPITLHRVLSEATNAGVTHAAMEASSHGLAQMRMDGVRLQAAAFTNLSQDHLDYHADFAEYFAAKAGLFRRVLGPDGKAVVHMDDARGPDMAEVAELSGHEVMRVGRSRENDLAIVGLRFDQTGQDVRFVYGDITRQVRLSLIGGFQAENVMVAAGLCIASGAEPAEVFAVLDQLGGVRGRMQLAATRGNGAAVYVDYSHTPGALSTALQALRLHVMGRIIVVFGAGGDRDRGKRILMGQAAAEYADIAIVTDDNPRSEDPATIRAAVMEGCPDATEVGDRAEAILRGVDNLGPGDALLIAGKGHETGQTVGETVYPFDDVEQASVAVMALDGQAL